MRVGTLIWYLNSITDIHLRDEATYLAAELFEWNDNATIYLTHQMGINVNTYGLEFPDIDEFWVISPQMYEFVCDCMKQCKEDK